MGAKDRLQFLSKWKRNRAWIIISPDITQCILLFYQFSPFRRVFTFPYWRKLSVVQKFLFFLVNEEFGWERKIGFNFYRNGNVIVRG